MYDSKEEIKSFYNIRKLYPWKESMEKIFLRGAFKLSLSGHYKI